jgi:pyruvate dehydrogenase E2 component (dihydrolipoamide acetyltransferase)
MAERVFALPDLGEGLEEATVDGWLVREGDEVALNQPIAQIETAKATVEVPSPFAGRIVKLHAAVGQTIAVGAALVTFAVDADAAERPGDVPGTAATPAVRRLARDLGIGLGTVTGTGRDGRVTRDDVERAADLPGDGGTHRRPLSPVRARIVANLERAASIPQVTTFRTVDCTALETFRSRLDVSPLPVVATAIADVASAHAGFRQTFEDGAIVEHDEIAIGIASDTQKGLLVPVVRAAGRLGIRGLAEEIARLAAAARDGSIAPGDLRGATTTITNTGSYGSESGTPLLNPPGAITVGLGLIEPRALVVDGRVEARSACTLSVTFDHRVLDGADVGRALNDLRELLENGDALARLPA